MIKEKFQLGFEKASIRYAVILKSFFVAVCIAGVWLELNEVSPDWKIIVRYISFGLPFLMGLVILLGHGTAWFKRRFSDGRLRPAIFFLVGVAITLQLIVWFVTQ